MPASECYPEKAPEVDTLLDTLSNNIQREVIHFFENFTTEDTASLDTLVSHIDGRVPSTDPTMLQTDLHHQHLPRLDARGWIEYDTRNKDVRYWGHERAEPLLADLKDVFTD